MANKWARLALESVGAILGQGYVGGWVSGLTPFLANPLVAGITLGAVIATAVGIYAGTWVADYMKV